MGDKVLGFLREARAAICEEQEAGVHNRPQSVTFTEIETAILWRQHDLQLRTTGKGTPCQHQFDLNTGACIHCGKSHSEVYE